MRSLSQIECVGNKTHKKGKKWYQRPFLNKLSEKQAREEKEDFVNFLKFIFTLFVIGGMTWLWNYLLGNPEFRGLVAIGLVTMTVYLIYKFWEFCCSR